SRRRRHTRFSRDWSSDVCSSDLYINTRNLAKFVINQTRRKMKIVKKILIVLAIIIAIPLIIALFVKKDYAVQREVTIDKPKQEVFDYIKYLKNQDNYSKWNKIDPEMKKSYKGTDGTVGFISRWESNKKEVGWGEQEIKKITE